MNNIEADSYCIKRLDRDNIADVAKLHAVVYGGKPPVAFLLKKYDTAYTEVNYVGFIAYNKQMLPVSFYGVIPCFIWCDSKMVLAAQSTDTMTHAEYRKRGLFVELAKRTFELCQAEGIRLVFGFPNQNSLHGFKHKLKWQMTDMMDCFIIPVKSIPLEKFAVKLPLFNKIYRAYSWLVLKKYLIAKKGIPNSLLTEGYDGVFRDDKYLNYKTYSTTKVIGIDGACIWVKINNGLIIGDMLNVKNNFDEIMNKLSNIARALGLNQILFQVSPDTRLHSLFASRNKSFQSFPVMFKDISAGMPVDKIKFTYSDIDIF